MAETKYGKYLAKEPLGKGGLFPIWVANGATHFEGAEFSMRLHYVTQEHVLIKEPHKHDFEQFLFFLGANLADATDFGAEIELSLGEEGEKHIITAATFVHLPIGLVHGPLNFKKVYRPVVLLDTLLSAQYTRKEMPR